jgi:short-subunit dehydrogenase
MTNVSKKSIFITGASSGIGAATAMRFAKEKARLLLCARRVDRLKELSASLINQFQVDVHYFVLDVQILKK